MFLFDVIILFSFALKSFKKTILFSSGHFDLIALVVNAYVMVSVGAPCFGTLSQLAQGLQLRWLVFLGIFLSSYSFFLVAASSKMLNVGKVH